VSRYKKKHSPTRTYPAYQPSLISFLHLLWSIASSLYSLCVWHSFQNLSKSSLVSLLVRNCPLHTLYIFSPCYSLLFATHAHTIATCFAVVPRLCHLFLVSWNTNFYFNIACLSDHSHLCPLKCHFIFFPYRPGLTPMQHFTLHTTAVQMCGNWNPKLSNTMFSRSHTVMVQQTSVWVGLPGARSPGLGMKYIETWRVLVSLHFVLIWNLT